jgi:hypothetical protein
VKGRRYARIFIAEGRDGLVLVLQLNEELRMGMLKGYMKRSEGTTTHPFFLFRLSSERSSDYFMSIWTVRPVRRGCWALYGSTP